MRSFILFSCFLASSGYAERHRGTLGFKAPTVAPVDIPVSIKDQGSYIPALKSFSNENMAPAPQPPTTEIKTPEFKAAAGTAAGGGGGGSSTPSNSKTPETKAPTEDGAGGTGGAAKSGAAGDAGATTKGGTPPSIVILASPSAIRPPPEKAPAPQTPKQIADDLIQRLSSPDPKTKKGAELDGKILVRNGEVLMELQARGYKAKDGKIVGPEKETPSEEDSRKKAPAAPAKT